MNSSYRRTAAILVVGGALASVILIQSHLRGQFSSDGQRPREKASVTLVEPTDTSRVLLSRLSKKVTVIERLVAGELTLTEAAAWFRYLNDNPADLPSNFRDFWPGNSDGEKACRQVIYWVDLELTQRLPASQVEEIVGGLQAEVESMLAETGTVELPW